MAKKKRTFGPASPEERQVANKKKRILDEKRYRKISGGIGGGAGSGGDGGGVSVAGTGGAS